MEKQNKNQKKKRDNYYTESWKNEIKLVEEERLLTQQEREQIINGYENRNWKIFAIICAIFFALVICLSSLLYNIGGEIKDAIVNFVIWTIIWVLSVGETYIISDKLLKSAKKNELYVREAVFLNSNKYHHATFEVMKKSRWEFLFCNAGIRESVKKGDVVILVQIKKKYVWVYKARKGEASLNEKDCL